MGLVDGLHMTRANLPTPAFQIRMPRSFRQMRRRMVTVDNLPIDFLAGQEHPAVLRISTGQIRPLLHDHLEPVRQPCPQCLLQTFGHPARTGRMQGLAITARKGDHHPPRCCQWDIHRDEEEHKHRQETGQHSPHPRECPHCNGYRHAPSRMHSARTGQPSVIVSVTGACCRRTTNKPVKNILPASKPRPSSTGQTDVPTMPFRYPERVHSTLPKQQ